jgi:hypothetical protein
MPFHEHKLIIAAVVASAVLFTTARAIAEDTFWYAIDLSKGICNIVDDKVIERARPVLQKQGWQHIWHKVDKTHGPWSVTLSGQIHEMPVAVILFATRLGCIETLRNLKRALGS